MAAKRKYPVGIQSFESIRRDGYLYIDKTELVYKMITEGKPYFLSRPRRFGKSLLVSTLEAVFLGRRELFDEIRLSDGTAQPRLYIATTDWEWQRHPVFHFDFSETSIKSHATLEEYISSLLSRYEQAYGITTSLKDSGHRFVNLVRTAHEQTGHRCVVLVDEYDNQMLHAIGDYQKEVYVKETFSTLFGPLKSLDAHLRFVFITGITKFSQMGIFSTLNQLNNISTQRQYETICGISEDELQLQLKPDIERLAEERGLAFDEQMEELKQMYDGYHFSNRMTDIYNPFSLISAFASQDISDYWFASGTPGAVVNMLAMMPPIDLNSISHVQCEVNEFDKAFDGYGSTLPVLYQSGYLTIKEYNRELDEYTLGFPNREVSRGFADCLYQHITKRRNSDDQDKSRLLRAYKVFRQDDNLPTFIDAVKTFFAGVPYHINGKDERHYHALLYTLLVAFGADVTAEESTAKGRSDLVLRMPKGIYIIKIKYDQSASLAMQQIEDRDYAAKYRLDDRPVTKVAINFSSKDRNITEWLAIKL